MFSKTDRKRKRGRGERIKERKEAREETTHNTLALFIPFAFHFKRKEIQMDRRMRARNFSNPFFSFVTFSLRFFWEFFSLRIFFPMKTLSEFDTFSFF